MDERFPRARPLGFEMPTGTDPLSVRKRIEAMELLLERSLVIPGTSYPIGLDSIVGLVPVIGDFVTAAMGAYIVWEARNLGIPKWKLWRMAGNIVFDSAVGAVPVLGDAFDLAFRSNSRNLKIVKNHLDKHHPATRVIEG
ncbi:DUF4112 domain-containing protein [Qipengyuania soli]|uniref:DUF4112 domain-containing protein n=1 Tax=Qipengyuania soli TaxID=2782568 RepID=A0A7S8IUM4_9SPHN|nr:DUF4112 domain-containing protein [Qipengyuania soli]QPC98535.1 DUF4112 domain-containing protein [Qipengyuania soli]